MTRRREFQTASARRRLEPIVWVIDGIDFKLRDDLVITDVAALADALTSARNIIGDANEADPVALLKATQQLVDSLIAPMTELLESDVRGAWPAVARQLDPTDLMAMVFDLVEEVTGRNPTSGSGSSPASPPSGEASTDGAQPVESTPLPSPSIDASTSGSTPV